MNPARLLDVFAKFRVGKRGRWVDSNWAGDTDTRRSYAVYIIMMNGDPISWKSRRQDSVALSTS
jgi:hypothetical protein